MTDPDLLRLWRAAREGDYDACLLLADRLEELGLSAGGWERPGRLVRMRHRSWRGRHERLARNGQNEVAMITLHGHQQRLDRSITAQAAYQAGLRAGAWLARQDVLLRAYVDRLLEALGCSPEGGAA